MTTIGLAVSEITCLIKMDTNTKQTERQTETGDYFFRSLGVMKLRENITVAIRPMDLAYAREVKKKNHSSLFCVIIVRRRTN